MKFKFKHEDFDVHCSECNYQAAEQANAKLEGLTGRYELFLTDDQCDKLDPIDIEPFVVHAYKQKE